MALDRRLTLLRGLPGESPEQSTKKIIDQLTRAAEHSLRNGDRSDACLARVGSETGDTGLALYLPAMSAERIVSVRERLRARLGNPYEILDSEGILLISSVQHRGAGLVLSGGSYCDVMLVDQGGRAIVRKSISKIVSPNDNDGLHRHKNEAQWLKTAHQFCDLFPKIEKCVDSLDLFMFETRFVPAYSLGELVFQRRMGANQLADTLISVYENLRSTLYARPPIPVNWPDKDEDYLEKIRRRSDRILDATRGTQDPVGALLSASRVRVNGRDCPALDTVFRAVRGDVLWRPVIQPATRHACHGDLILEDILLREGPRPEIALIDPNPYNGHCLYDLAKTMLSLWIGYEFVYFDSFQVSSEMRDGQVSVEIGFTEQECRDRYKVGASNFLDYAKKELRSVLNVPEDSFERLVCMATALTALAIPSFHLIHHHRPDRALGFLALGLLYASYALTNDIPATWDDTP